MYSCKLVKLGVLCELVERLIVALMIKMGRSAVKEQTKVVDFGGGRDVSGLVMVTNLERKKNAGSGVKQKLRIYM